VKYKLKYVILGEKNMCKWSDNRGMGDEQSVLSVPEHVKHVRQNKETVCVDKCIQHVIEHLWKHEVLTLGCCCGHGKAEFNGAEVIIGDGYNAEEINNVKAWIKEVDDRPWKVLQWGLREV